MPMKTRLFLLSFFSLLYGLSSGQSVPIEWENLVNVGYYNSHEAVRKISKTKSWDAWARSKNVFRSNLEFALRYKTEPEPTSNADFILAVGPAVNTYTYQTVQFGFHIDKTKIFVIQNGTVINTYPKNGIVKLELKRVRVSGGFEMHYRMQGTTVHITPCSNQIYRGYTLIRRYKAIVRDVSGSSFLTVKTTPTGCPGSTGSISLTANAGVPPFTYSWTDGATSASRNNLEPGTYGVTVQDDVGNQVSQNIVVAQAVGWQNVVAATYTTSKIHQALNNVNASANSINAINGVKPGLLKFKAINTVGLKAIGFSPPGTNAGVVRYGFYMGNNQFLIFHNGAVAVGAASYSAAETFSIERDANGNMIYKKGTTVLHAAPANANEPLQIYANLGNQGSGFDQITATFCEPTPMPASFAQPKRQLDAGYHLVTDAMLRFTYKGEYPNHPAEFLIRNELGQVVASQATAAVSNAKTGATQVLKLSDGYYEIDLETVASGTYVLEILHPENETQYLRFKH